MLAEIDRQLASWDPSQQLAAVQRIPSLFDLRSSSPDAVALNQFTVKLTGSIHCALASVLEKI